MNSLKTVLFPATVIHSIRQYPLFLMFPKLHIIAPAESDAKAPEDDPTDSFINSGLCQVDTPCPLGEDLLRFHHLVTDIRNRKDDYASQLSSLTLAAMSSGNSTGEESERAIINEFLTPKDVEAEEAKQNRQAKLWQARLVLAIGEILDREEEEIAKSLSLVDDDTSGLFNALKGEIENFDQDSPFAELSQLKTNINAVHSGNIDKRLSAWSQLFAESSLQNADLFITTSADTIDILSESYDKACGQLPAHYEGIEIPGLIAKNAADAVMAISDFQNSNNSLLERLADTFTTRTTSDQIKDGIWETIVADWKDALDQSFPEDRLGRLPVTLYVYNGCDLKSLLGQDKAESSGKNAVVIYVGY